MKLRLIVEGSERIGPFGIPVKLTPIDVEVVPGKTTKVPLKVGQIGFSGQIEIVLAPEEIKK